MAGQIPTSWDHQADVVVVGCGFAGAVAAITAHDIGAEVLILEKASHVGGISICSGGGLRTAKTQASALAYLEAASAGLTPRPVLAAFARGMTEVAGMMAAFGQLMNAQIETIDYPGNYPFPGHEDLGFVMFKKLEGFEPHEYYPHVRGLRGGARHFRVMEENLRARALKPMTRTAATRLVTSLQGRVLGLIALREGRQVTIRARRGVVLASGGFEGSKRLLAQFVSPAPILSTAYLQNTGDGLRMAQAVGAGLWHMNNIHGAYGLKHPDPAYPYGIRLARLPDWSPAFAFPQEASMAWILVDRQGRRYMNEYPPYLQDTGYKEMLHLDPATQSHPRAPSFLLLDEEGRKLYPLALPTYNDPEVSLDWSEDNLAEVAAGLIQRAQTLEEAATAMGLDPTQLIRTVERYNGFAAQGRDEDFARPGPSMIPIQTPPFYWAPAWPILSNTQGGPVHDEHWRVLDAFDQPIPGLYEAGELGGIFGHLYLAGGNLAECYIGGRAAGQHAAVNAPE